MHLTTNISQQRCFFLVEEDWYILKQQKFRKEESTDNYDCSVLWNFYDCVDWVSQCQESRWYWLWSSNGRVFKSVPSLQQKQTTEECAQTHSYMSHFCREIVQWTILKRPIHDGLAARCRPLWNDASRFQETLVHVTWPPTTDSPHPTMNRNSGLRFRVGPSIESSFERRTLLAGPKSFISA